jgi:uncharacterized protein with PQ loop repeat
MVGNAKYRFCMETPLAYLPFVAAAFGIPQYLPQILRLRATGDTAGVSWAWATLTSVNNAGWLGYFVLSAYWPATLPSSAATLLAGGVAVTLAKRGAASRRAASAVSAWSALLVIGYAVAGRAGLGGLLTVAFVVQTAPSLWTAYRTDRPTGIAPGTWLLVLGELTCWLTYGLWRSDPRLIALGLTGVTAAVLMLTRVWWTRRTGRVGQTPRSAPPSRREDLGVVGERLELQGVAGRVEQEHRPLLAGLPLETHVGLDDERGAGRAQPLGEFVEARDRQDQAEVRHRDVVAVDRVVDPLGAPRGEVGDELVAVQVPVDPGVGAATLFQAEHVAVEAARGGQVVDRHGQVESRDRRVENAHVLMLTSTTWPVGFPP